MKAPVAERIERSLSLRERVYEWMRAKILVGELAPGDQIVETRLAEQLGVSRTPVHQAVSQLEQEGFVVTEPPGNISITAISDQDILDVFELREILETSVMRATVGKFTPDELAEMEAVLLEAEGLLERGEILAFLKVNRSFHHLFDHKHGNRRISAILENLDNHIYRILTVQFRRVPGDLSATFNEHRLIFEAVKAGDAEEAVSVLTEHLRAATLEVSSCAGEEAHA